MRVALLPLPILSPSSVHVYFACGIMDVRDSCLGVYVSVCVLVSVCVRVCVRVCMYVDELMHDV